MADISQYLQAIMTAVYGEDVRGSIHDAIEIINEVSEVVLTTGTAVSSASSSSTGFFENSLYLNTTTYELWKCIGTDTWESQGILKGDPGTPGADGNKWYRGTNISGKAVNPTVYSSSGIADANENDLYLNPSEGAVYHCVLGGDPTTATWSYDFTMTGGGGGGSVVGWNQIQTSTGATKIAEITIDGSKTDVYAPQGGGGSSTFAGLDDTDITNPQADQIVQYKSVGGSLKLQNVNMPQGGHTMIPTTNDIATIKGLSDGDDNYVINAYSAKRWSNTESVALLTTVPQGEDTMGTWEADDTWETSGVRTGWLCHELLTDILSDNDVEMTLVFDPLNSELVSAYAYRIDDHYTVTQDGVTKTVGGIAIKFNGAIQSNSVTVGVRLKWNRTQTITVPRSGS